jgi:hypothetical protein
VTASADLTAIAAAVRDVPRTAIAAAAEAVRTVALDNARAAAGGDLALTGKHRGIPLDVEVTDMSQPDGARVRLAGTPAGPWVWIDTGTRPHTIPRRRRGNLSRLRVHHPGTAGKHAWGRTVEAAPELARTATVEALNRGLVIR